MGNIRGIRLALIHAVIIWFTFQRLDYSAVSPTFAGPTISAPVISSGDSYLSRKEPKNCRRRCSHRKGKLHYTEPTDGGLEDRIRVINGLSNLAAFLCAELYLQPPVDLLQPYHNGMVKLGTDLEWEDFLQARLIGSDDQIFKLHTQNSSSFASESKDHNSREHVVTTEWWKAKDDFKLIHSASFENKPFVWEIRVSYWYLTRQYKGLGLNSINVDDILPKQLEREEYVGMLPTESRFQSIELEAKHAFLADISRGCTYVKLDYSHPIKLMQQSLENEIRRQSDQQIDDALFGLLHLRRGDAIGICDTSLEKVKSYLHCSLGGIEGIQNTTLVMTSEEKDVGYRKSILGLVDEFPNLAILDGDDMAKTIVDDAAKLGRIGKSMVNGFVVFAVEGTLRDPNSKLVRFRLVRRRSRCLDCSPAVYQAFDPSRAYRFEGNQLRMTPIE